MSYQKSFFAELKKNVAGTWEKEKVHPFVLGIGDGTLPAQKFRYYMMQDYIFLIEFCRVVALAVAKAGTVDDMAWFARLLHETLNTEMSLHIDCCGDFGITEEELKATRPSPTTYAYTRHMVRSGYGGGAGEIAAAILPCSWGYAEIGRMLEGSGVPEGRPLYARWIYMYSSPEFAELSEWLRVFIDRIAADSGDMERQRMADVFLASSQYEYMFWDAAYRMEEWPI